MLYTDGCGAGARDDLSLSTETASRQAKTLRPEARGAQITATLTRRPVVLGVAALLFAAVFALTGQSSDSDDAIGLLYVIPVAIVGLEFGLAAGLLAAAAALGLMGAWVAMRHPEIDSVGLATRTVAILSVGALAGYFSDRMRAQAAMHSELEHTRGRISEQLRSAHRLLDHDEAERVQVAHQLHEQVAQTVAAALMALSLLEHDPGEARLDRFRIETVRGHMRECLEDLRGLAESMRPAVLAELGLLPALERICAKDGKRTGQSIALHSDGRLERLPPGAEIAAYRTVEEALGALSGTRGVWASVDEEERWLRIAVASSSGDWEGRGGAEELATTRARLQLLGGSLRIDSPAEEGAAGINVVADIPLRQTEIVDPGMWV